MKKTPSGYSLRIAKVQDAETIVAQRIAMFSDLGANDKSRLEMMTRKFQVWVRRKLRTGEYRGWFVTDGNGRIVAGAGVWIMEWPPVPMDSTGRRAYVLNVYTDPDHRRKGLARLLMNAILVWCKRKRFVTVTLHASDYGRPLYESLGFKPTREMRLQFEPARKPPKRPPKRA